jgi:uncharacterized membrane protein
MRTSKPLMFAALAGLPLAIVPAMAQTETPAQASTSSSTTSQGTTYSQSGPATDQSVTTVPRQAGSMSPENAGGGAGAGGGESGGSGGGGSGK